MIIKIKIIIGIINSRYEKSTSGTSLHLGIRGYRTPGRKHHLDRWILNSIISHVNTQLSDEFY